MTDDDTGDNTSQIKFEAGVTTSGKWSDVSHGAVDVLHLPESFLCMCIYTPVRKSSPSPLT